MADERPAIGPGGPSEEPYRPDNERLHDSGEPDWVSETDPGPTGQEATPGQLVRWPGPDAQSAGTGQGAGADPAAGPGLAAEAGPAGTDAQSAQASQAANGMPGSQAAAGPAAAQAGDVIRTARPAQPQGPGTQMYADEARIGLWGSTGSGKTTFLAALRQTTQTDHGYGGWAIHPGNHESAALLVRLTRELVVQREFPNNTMLGESHDLSWVFAPTTEPARGRRWPWRGRPPERSGFQLSLVDVSGEAYRDRDPAADRKMPVRVSQMALDHLAASQGLLYLFDPIEERKKRDSANFFNQTVVELSRRMVAENRLFEGYLPHQISVCITKFDHPEIFQNARKANLVNSGPDGIPRVLDEHAKIFFDLLCDGGLWGNDDELSNASAPFIQQELRRRFHPDRIRYFACSSIGFRRPRRSQQGASGPGANFDPDNYSNIVEQPGRTGIRDAIYPINVLEPLISLQQRIKAPGPRRSARSSA